MTELPKSPHLNYTQLINILCVLAERIEAMEDIMEALDEYMKGVDQTQEFQNYQIIKTRLENMREDNRTPRQRLNELEKQFSGMVNFVNTKLAEEQPRKPKRKTQYS